MTAVVVAAGRGERAGGGEHGKLFVPLLGRPLLVWSLQCLDTCDDVDDIVIVTRERQVERVRQLARTRNLRKVRQVTQGGQERLDSVRAGLRMLGDGVSHVVVHDGARPLCSVELTREVIVAARRFGAALAAAPMTDTVKCSEDGQWVDRTLDRSRLWRAQTPQAFERKLLERACRELTAGATGITDDAMLVERLGARVRVVPGSPTNLKVTHAHDFAVAEALLRASETTP